MPKPSPRQLREAERWFDRRVPLDDEERTKLRDEAKRQAFWLAQVTDLRLVDDVLRSLSRAVARRDDFARWKATIGERIKAAWGPGARDRGGRIFNQGARLRLVFHNATATAVNSGRYIVLRSPQVRALRPFWTLENPSPESDICRALVGTTMPADAPGWDGRVPPLHHFCHTELRALTRREAEARGLRDPGGDAAPGFGQAPKEGVRGLADVDLSLIDAGLREMFEAKTEAA